MNDAERISQDRTLWVGVIAYNLANRWQRLVPLRGMANGSLRASATGW